MYDKLLTAKPSSSLKSRAKSVSQKSFPIKGRDVFKVTSASKMDFYDYDKSVTQPIFKSNVLFNSTVKTQSSLNDTLTLTDLFSQVKSPSKMVPFDLKTGREDNLMYPGLKKELQPI